MLVAGSGVALLALALAAAAGDARLWLAAAALLFLAAAALTLSGAQLLFRRFASNVPGFTTATLAIGGGGDRVGVGDEDLGREKLAPKPQALLECTRRPGAAPAPQQSSAVPTSPRRCNVNAHGGGLRAAVFTAQVLARADDATCGGFGKQVAAFSGVSGGSVGIATYLLARQELVARGGWGRTPAARDASRQADRTRRWPTS